MQVFDFDFADVGPDTLAAAQMAHDVTVHTPGVFNAIAFWFELRLDADNTLSTSPHDGTKGQTWQQAVQWVEEVSMNEGDVLPIVASHDTYAITFAVDDARFPQRAQRRTGVPLYDPSWGVQHERLKAVNHQVRFFLVIFGFFWLFLVILVWAIVLTSCFLYRFTRPASARRVRVVQRGDGDARQDRARAPRVCPLEPARRRGATADRHDDPEQRAGDVA